MCGGLMLIKDLVADLNNKISAIIRNGPDNPDILISLDSKILTIQFNKLLNHYADSPNEVNAKSLRPFVEFLSNRWARITHTDAVYMHHPHSFATQLCVLLAKTLGQLLNKSCYELLLPGVNVQVKTSKDNLAALELCEFILADDDVTPIEILPCLQQAILHPDKVMFHTCFAEGIKQPLSEHEGLRVINHSSHTLLFFQKKSVKLAEKLATPNAYLVTASYQIGGINKLAAFMAEILLRDRDCEKINVSDLGYDKGSERLSALFAEIGRQAPTRFDLLDFIQYQVSKKDWPLMLEKVPKTTLPFLFLQIDSKSCSLLEAACNPLSYSQDDETHNRLVLLAFLKIYSEMRSNDAQYSQSLGFFANIVGETVTKYVSEKVGGYSREEKLKAVALYSQFLVSDLPLNQLNVFLNDHLTAIEEEMNPTKLYEAVRIKNALEQDGTLSVLAKQAAIVCRDDFYLPLVKRVGVM